MERFLVTGGMGFLGTHLCERLLEEGKEVWALDLFEPPFAARLREYPGFRLVVDTIRNPTTLAKLVDRCDAVCHLAAIASPEQYVSNARKTMDIGLRAGLDVVEQVRLTGKFLFFTSTSEVYGRNPKVPWRETDDRVLGATDVDRWCYSTSKAVLEHYIRACQLDGQLDHVTVRVFNAYGPRLKDRVLARFLDDALLERPLIIHGDGQQTRCFTYVADLVDAFVRLIQTPSAHNRVYNVGTDHEVTIEELAKSVLAISGSPSELQYVPHAEAFGTGYEDIPRRVPDITRVRRAIGWEPATPLDVGLACSIAYRERELAAETAHV